MLTARRLAVTVLIALFPAALGAQVVLERDGAGSVHS